MTSRNKTAYKGVRRKYSGETFIATIDDHFSLLRQSGRTRRFRRCTPFSSGAWHAYNMAYFRMRSKKWFLSVTTLGNLRQITFVAFPVLHAFLQRRGTPKLVCFRIGTQNTISQRRASENKHTLITIVFTLVIYSYIYTWMFFLVICYLLKKGRMTMYIVDTFVDTLLLWTHLRVLYPSRYSCGHSTLVDTPVSTLP